MQDRRTSLVGIYLRGLAMGSADVVPGVSGGTIALITGIYDRLLAALSNVDVGALRMLARGDIRRAWQHVDGSFLLTLLAGIATAVLTLAELIHWLMAHHPLPLWSMFFGLVLTSAVWLVQQEVGRPDARAWLALVAGVALAASIGLSPAGELLSGTWGVFLAGALAICAMILPGISGSFILLLIGMYQPIIAAVTGRDLLTLAEFAAGCATGLLLFTRFLHWLLEHTRRTTMALLSGFLFGSLVTLWPWQHTVSTTIDRHGDERVVQTAPVLPHTWAVEHDDPQWLLCLLAAIAGALVVIVAHRLSTADGSSARGEPSAGGD